MDLTKLPANLPQPVDDNSYDHLLGMTIPNIILPSTKGKSLDVCTINSNFLILYFFPMMALSETELPKGWNEIPGARGCTPQNINIGKQIDNLQKYDAIPIGISTQPINELSKISTIRRIPQTLLSDNNLRFTEKLNIPTFQVDDRIMYKRLTLVLKKFKIIKVFYPIFPPNQHISEILDWLEKTSTNA